MTIPPNERAAILLLKVGGVAMVLAPTATVTPNWIVVERSTGDALNVSSVGLKLSTTRRPTSFKDPEILQSSQVTVSRLSNVSGNLDSSDVDSLP